MRCQFEQLHRERPYPFVSQGLAGKIGDLEGELPDRPALSHQQHLAAQQVQRLDTGGPFIERGNAGVADNLLHAVLADIAVAAEHLYPQVGGFVAQLGQEAFQNGGQKAQPVIVSIRFLLITSGVAFHHVVGQPCGVVQHGTPALGDGFLGQQHAADIGMVNQAVGHLVGFFLTRQGAHGAAFPGVIQSPLVGQFRRADTLDGSADPRGVHEGEHAVQPFVLRADQETGGIVEVHHAGG